MYLAHSAREIVPYTAVVLLLLVLTILALWREPPLGFCGLWFFLVLGPTSVLPLVTQTGAEHRMYLPLAGLIGACVVGGYRLFRLMNLGSGRIQRAGLGLILGLAVTLLGARTAVRNEDYRSELSLWQTVVDRWPINPRAHYNLGNALLKTGRLPEAIAQYDDALRLQPDYAHAHVNLGSTLAKTGRLPEAIAHYEAALRLEPDLAGGRLPEVIAQLEAALHVQAHPHRSDPFGEAGGATQK
jgi:thioredoxin-like negative regulator of GroEL